MRISGAASLSTIVIVVWDGLPRVALVGLPREMVKVSSGSTAASLRRVKLMLPEVCPAGMVRVPLEALKSEPLLADPLLKEYGTLTAWVVELLRLAVADTVPAPSPKLYVLLAN